jgi:hypothetical protein
VKYHRDVIATRFIMNIFIFIMFLGIVIGGMGLFSFATTNYTSQETKDFMSFGLGSICLAVTWVAVSFIVFRSFGLRFRL